MPEAAEAPPPAAGSVPPPDTAPRSPYPGLRPYERSEQALFFGRDRDAELLANKVLAAPVTVLFGQSGRGKSSLLRALLVPRLEEEGARVFTFDGWAAEDPVAALVERLGEAAGDALAEPGAREAAPPPSGRRERSTSALQRLVRRLSAYDPRPLVLVLDQFEELLLRHGGRIEPIRREIAALLRDEEVECRVLISLREEFLAALEPFRRDIPALFDSTFRLEPLSEVALREAIARPAERFGMSVAPALVDVLLRDLGDGAATAPGARSAPGARTDRRGEVSETARPTPRSGSDDTVELPILQLVLSELWRSARAARTPALTVEAYEAIGGAAKVRTDYVASVMPTRRQDRLTTARLLRHLAPPSGYKASYSVEDLVEATDLPRSEVARELDRLRNAGILRVRDFRDRRLFELQHDALIGVLAPWREQVLRHDRQRRWTIRATAAAAMVVLLAGLGVYVKREADLREQRSAQAAVRRDQEEALGRTMAELSQMSVPDRERQVRRIEEGVRLLLQSSDDPARFDRLAQVLKANVELLPQAYGYQLPKELEAAPPADDWPYVLEFSPRRKLDSADGEEGGYDRERLFRLHWQEYAKFVGKSWGFPVPSQIKLRRNPNLPARRLRLMVGSREVLATDAELNEDRPVLASKELTGVLREVLDRLGGPWPAASLKPESAEWRAVPRWSLPIWSAYGTPATDGTAATALFFMQSLINAPGPLMADAAPLLTERIKRSFPTTAAEAIAARGESTLALDLAEVVKKDTGLVDLPMILDVLGSLRNGETSIDAAAEVVEDLSANAPFLPEVLGAAPGAKAPVADSDAEALEPSSAVRRALEPSLIWVEPREQRIRVYAGSDLLGQAFDQAEKIRPEAAEAFDQWRDAMTRRFGILPPALRFRSPDSEWPVASDRGFRVAFLNQGAANPDASEVTVAPGESSLPPLVRELSWGIQGLRQRLVTAETASEIVGRADAPVAEWLRGSFTTTDIKTLMRAVVAPDTAERDAIIAREHGGALPPSDPTRSMRHATWLLAALVLIEPTLGRETSALGEALRTLQARKGLPASSGPPASDPPSPGVSAAIEALLAGEIEKAQAALPESAARLAALPSILSGYAARFPEWRSKRVRAACEDPTYPGLDREGRLDVEDLLAAGDAGALPLADLRLCLYAAMLSLDRPSTAGQLSEAILAAEPDPGRWTPERAAWFGQKLLSGSRRSGDPPDRLEAAIAFLKSAGDRLDDAKAAKLAVDLDKRCSTTSPFRWCDDILDTLAEARPDRFALDRADLVVARASDPRRVRRGLDLLDRYLAVAPTSPGALKEPDRQEVAQLIRALAEMKLAEAAGDDGRLARLAETWRQLGTSVTADWRRANAHVGLMRTLLAQGRGREVKPLLDFSFMPETVRPSFEGDRLGLGLAVALLERDRPALANFVGASSRKADAEPSGADAFARVISSLMGGDERRATYARPFVRGEHPYRDIVAVLYAVFTEEGDREDARLLLEERWKAVDPSSWQRRWQQADISAWYEFLLGYFLGKPETDLSAATKLASDESRAGSPFADLPSTRRELLCEFLFYDTMKALADGNVDRARTGLEEVRAQRVRRYFESSMAEFLLGDLGPARPPN